MPRVWSETLPHRELLRPAVTDLLRRYRLDPIVAVRPWELRDAPRLAASLADAGLRVAVWPMLGDADGRWASTHVAGAFADFARRLADACVPLAEVAVDYEPPFAYARALTGQGTFGEAARAMRDMAREGNRTFGAGRRELAALAGDLRARGVRTMVAVLPHVLLAPRGNELLERALGCPMPGDHAAHVTVMAYTSMFEGLSRGLVGRPAARSLLRASCRGARRRFGDRGGVSLGAVGPGALGDEPVFRAATELADDAAIARAVGVEPTLFDLAGVLARPPAEAWLDAFTRGA